MRLHDKVIAITGGGRGIGKALALAFAGEGADICLLARTTTEIEAVAEQVRRLDRRGAALTCDVSDPAAVTGAFETIVTQLGRIDILINNAGGDFVRGNVADSRVDHWKQAIESNLLGTYYCCRAVIPHMIEQGGGKIINIGSGMGHTARPGNSAYNTAKAGVWMFTQCLAMEVWHHGIDVNELIPGPVHTALTAGYFDPAGDRHPIIESERVKRPEDCIPLAIYLATQPAGGPTAQSFSLARRPI